MLSSLAVPQNALLTPPHASVELSSLLLQHHGTLATNDGGSPNRQQFIESPHNKQMSPRNKTPMEEVKENVLLRPSNNKQNVILEHGSLSSCHQSKSKQNATNPQGRSERVSIELALASDGTTRRHDTHIFVEDDDPRRQQSQHD